MSLALALLLACSPTPEPGPANSPVTPVDRVAAPAPSPVVPDQVVLQIDDLPTLQLLDAGGTGPWSLNAVLNRANAQPPHTDGSTAELTAHNPGFAALASAWTTEIDAVVGAVRRDLVTEHADAVKWPASNVGRRFDTRWLASTSARFELIGVVNRVDRSDFHRDSDGGEVRLIYRLAYAMPGEDGTVRGSRLPFTVNAVLVYPRDTPEQAARRWLDAPESPDERLGWLQSGPLDPTAVSLLQVEVNSQVVRFPSGVETEFAGQALYLLQVFRLVVDGAGLKAVAQPLENTPDVGALRADPSLATALERWILGNLDAIDEGVYRIPDEVLARRALTWSTLGMNRADNKPFEALFGADWNPELPAVERQFFTGPRALLERLDNQSCTGCHQAGSTAGFHLLGRDDPQTAGITNRLLLPRSPHAQSEVARRRSWLLQVLRGEPPDRSRTHSLYPGRPTSRAGGTCVPDGAPVSDAARWGCDPGLVCRVLAQDAHTALPFGTCIADPLAESPALRAGNPCREGTVELATRDPAPTEAWNVHGYTSRFAQRPLYDLPEDKHFSSDAFNCRPTVIGVPLGRTYRSCTPEERALSAPPGDFPDELCAVVGGSQFDQCVEGDFHSCLAGVVGRGMVDGCSAERPCREDYICQALPYQVDSVPTAEAKGLTDSGIGFCTPTYFLFQLRLDGHPVPPRL